MTGLCFNCFKLSSLVSLLICINAAVDGGFLDNVLPKLEETIGADLISNGLESALDMLSGNGIENQWIPQSFPTRHDLQCVCVQKRDYKAELEKCCSCHAGPIWSGKEIEIYVEYVAVGGKAVLVNDAEFNSSTVYKASHSYGELRHLPSNLCNWDTTDIATQFKPVFAALQPFWKRIVKLDLPHNQILDIGDISCLDNLDYLNLAHNQITHVPKFSLIGLSHLRHLYLNNNRITTMDSGILLAPSMHLTNVDLSENQLRSVDVTNIVSNYPFCHIDFSFNFLDEITNEKKVSFGCEFTCEKSFGPGFVSFHDNVFERFPDFKELLGLNSLSQLGQLMGFGFDFMNIKVKCDCVLEPFLELAMDVIEAHWRDYMNVTCFAPQHLKEIPIVKVPLEEFTCDLGKESNCPVPCNCTDKPYIDTILVNCSNRGLTKIPEEVPTSKFSDYIDLRLNGNQIRMVHNTSYFTKTSSLNLSDNAIVSIDEAATATLFNATIDLSRNAELRVLPQGLQFRNMCRIHLNELIINCDCESSWLFSWFSVKRCNDPRNLKCRVPEHGIIMADNFDSDMIDCDDASKLGIVLASILSVMVVLSAVIGVIVIYFKYELLICVLRLVRKKSSGKQSRVHPGYKYDVYLSFDHEDDFLRLWVGRTLRSYLEDLGYKVFYPPRDMIFGAIVVNDTVTAIQRSKCFLLVLSQAYVDQEDRCWVDEEWKFAWNMFKSDTTKTIVLVNYDHISSFDVAHNQIKAFLRVGGQVAFDNHDGEIMGEITTKIGPPTMFAARGDKKVDNKGGNKANDFDDVTVVKSGRTLQNAKPLFRMVKTNKPGVDKGMLYQNESQDSLNVLVRREPSNVSLKEGVNLVFDAGV